MESGGKSNYCIMMFPLSAEVVAMEIMNKYEHVFMY